MNEGIIKLLFKQVRSSVYKFFGKRIKKAINRDWLGLNDEELKELGYEEMYEYLKEITKFTARYHYCTPPLHIPRLFHWLYDEVLEEDRDMWKVVGEWGQSYLVGLVRTNETR